MGRRVSLKYTYEIIDFLMKGNQGPSSRDCRRVGARIKLFLPALFILTINLRNYDAL